MSFLDEIQRIAAGTGANRSDLDGHTFVCPCCGKPQSGIMDLAVDGPACYLTASPEAQAADFFKTDDFCVWQDEDFFVRGVLPIPVLATGQYFGLGTWSSLSKTNFDLYSQHWDDDSRARLGPWFGWFSNFVRPYPDTLNLKCHVHPQDDGLRPLIELEPTDHPLAVDQREGITVERLFEIYDANGCAFTHDP